jgi:hypothetical protein
MTGITPIDPISVERIAPVRALAASAPVRAQESEPLERADTQSSTRIENAGVLDYARANARITEILASIGASTSSTSSLSNSQNALESLLRTPTVIIPMPPASVDMVQQAVYLAKRLAQQADLALRAQANVTPAMADQFVAGER